MKRALIGILGSTVAWALIGTTPGLRAQEREAPMARPPASGVLGLLGSGGYLGVRIEDVDAGRAEDAGLSGEYGVWVEEVTEDGPAARAGLEAGDILTAWNGERLESVAQLQRLVRETPVGRAVEVTAVRDGRERTVSVEIGDRADAFGDLRVFTVPREREALRERLRGDMQNRLRGPSDVRIRVFGGRPRLGVSIQGLGDQLAEYFGVEGGALIASVREDSPAEAAGLRAGDVIVGIGGEDVDDAGDVGRILADRDAGPVEVRIVRDRSERTVTVELEEGGVGRSDGPGILYYGDGDGIWLDGVGVDPMSIEGFDIGPIELDAFDVRVPRIEVPDIRIPRIELPRLVVPSARAIRIDV